MSVPLRTRSARNGSTLTRHRPPPALSAAVVCTWEGRPDRPRVLRVLPDGCADLSWDGRRLTVAGVAAGPVGHPVGEPVVGLRMRIGAVGRVLGHPAHELPGSGVDLVQLWGPRASTWEHRLADAPDPADARAVLAELVAEHLADGHGPDPLLARAARLLAGDHGAAAVADAVGLSDRELRRRCRNEAGIGPKALHRVLRFGRFRSRLASVATGRRTLADVAAELGYVDQAHLARECRALAGASPSGLARLWSAHAGPSAL